MSKINCAVYTRKSTEKGLDMEFNSLQNQEEACKAYILSQAFHHWEYYKTYSDGGISGGTMDRPGLQRLLEDIRAGQIQVVVVYKVDRLSRSIFDFHRMMQEFDKYDCNFVSITQSFDTSNSMGKLTLNMLLSFAQFEREVSAERVRDKIAASKAKGLWLGGYPPLGYRLVDKQLIPDETEIPIIETIFKKYLEVGTMDKLFLWLNEHGYRTKVWKSKKGSVRGGKLFQKSTVQHILTNPLYIGKITHFTQHKVYDGKHAGIISPELFSRVQEHIHRRIKEKRERIKRRLQSAFLSGILFDEQGNKFCLSAANKNGRLLRYYYTRETRQYLPLEQLDQFVLSVCKNIDFGPLDVLADSRALSADMLKKALCRVICTKDRHLYYLQIIFNTSALQGILEQCPHSAHLQKGELPLTIDGVKCWIKTQCVIDNISSTKLQNGCANNVLTVREMNESLVRGLSRGWQIKKLIERGMQTREYEKFTGMNKRTLSRYLNLCYLSPRIIASLLEYRNPQNMSLKELMTLAEGETDFNIQEKKWFGL